MSSKPLLVLIHGWGANAAVWSNVVAELENDFDVLTPELPGHGRSTIAVGDLCATVQAIGEQVQRPAYWLGWSLGALLTMQAAITMPDKVKALLLVSATPAFIQAEEWQTAMPADEFNAFQKNFMENPGRTLSRFMALQAQGDENAKVVLRQLKKISDSNAADLNQMAWGLTALKTTGFRQQLGDISQPLYLLHGANDQIAPVGAAQSLATIQGSQLQTWDDTGHAPFLSRPTRFVNWVKEVVA